MASFWFKHISPMVAKLERFIFIERKEYHVKFDRHYELKSSIVPLRTTQPVEKFSYRCKQERNKLNQNCRRRKKKTNQSTIIFKKGYKYDPLSNET